MKTLINLALAASLVASCSATEDPSTTTQNLPVEALLTDHWSEFDPDLAPRDLMVYTATYWEITPEMRVIEIVELEIVVTKSIVIPCEGEDVVVFDLESVPCDLNDNIEIVGDGPVGFGHPEMTGQDPVYPDSLDNADEPCEELMGD